MHLGLQAVPGGWPSVLVVEWPTGSRVPRVLDLVESLPGQPVSEALPFSRVWRQVAEHIRRGGAANEIDVLVTNRPVKPMTLEAIRASGLPTAADVSVPYRGGVYLFPRSLLQDLAVTSNNRAVLIPKTTIQGLLGHARELGLSTPLPLWYTVYAQERPPDMYSAQRAEYDSRTPDIGGEPASHVCCLATVFAHLERWRCAGT